ncbi:MAG: 4-hydroxythreonine-4-phosphate dehydrogenase PdxA [Acidobacteriota bacterium]
MNNTPLDLPRIAITMGDPAGIGPELCLQVLEDPRVLDQCIPVVFGDGGILKSVAACCHFPEPATVLVLSQWKGGANIQGPALVDCQLIASQSVRPGQVQPECGRAAFGYVRTAVESALEGRVAAIATAPINKEALKEAGVPYPGHTEMLAALTGSSRFCMMLSSEELTVSMVTTHIGLAQVPAHLSRERVLEVIRLTAGALERQLQRAPRISVCGLNPHAGENGLFGNREEEEIILPAIEEARRQGLEVAGPLPPDTAFVAEKRKGIDGIICMYHDQGHIPFKMLAFDRGVNVTLGLPVIRTSVDHGTAFDIAWKGRAIPVSLIQAILCAVRLSRNGTSR